MLCCLSVSLTGTHCGDMLFWFPKCSSSKLHFTLCYNTEFKCFTWVSQQYYLCFSILNIYPKISLLVIFFSVFDCQNSLEKMLNSRVNMSTDSNLPSLKNFTMDLWLCPLGDIWSCGNIVSCHSWERFCFCPVGRMQGACQYFNNAKDRTYQLRIICLTMSIVLRLTNFVQAYLPNKCLFSLCFQTLAKQNFALN